MSSDQAIKQIISSNQQLQIDLIKYYTCFISLKPNNKFVPALFTFATEQDNLDSNSGYIQKKPYLKIDKFIDLSLQIDRIESISFVDGHFSLRIIQSSRWSRIYCKTALEIQKLGSLLSTLYSPSSNNFLQDLIYISPSLALQTEKKPKKKSNYKFKDSQEFEEYLINLFDRKRNNSLEYVITVLRSLIADEEVRTLLSENSRLIITSFWNPNASSMSLPLIIQFCELLAPIEAFRSLRQALLLTAESRMFNSVAIVAEGIVNNFWDQDNYLFNETEVINLNSSQLVRFLSEILEVIDDIRYQEKLIETISYL